MTPDEFKAAHAILRKRGYSNKGIARLLGISLARASQTFSDWRTGARPISQSIALLLDGYAHHGWSVEWILGDDPENFARASPQRQVKVQADDDIIRKMWIEGATFAEMAEATGRTKNGVYQRATVWLRLHRTNPRPPGLRMPK